MRYSALILAVPLALAAPSCGGGLEDSLSTQSQGGGASQAFATADLDGLWNGLAVPVQAGNLPLEQTLGFASYGEGRDEIRLTHYSFPSPRSTGTVDYLALISFYEVFYNAGGRLQLETRYLGFGPLGGFIDEQVTKVLWMDEDRQAMVGTESIRVFEAGRLTISVDSVLAMDRLN